MAWFYWSSATGSNAAVVEEKVLPEQAYEFANQEFVAVRRRQFRSNLGPAHRPKHNHQAMSKEEEIQA